MTPSVKRFSHCATRAPTFLSPPPCNNLIGGKILVPCEPPFGRVLPRRAPQMHHVFLCPHDCSSYGPIGETITVLIKKYFPDLHLRSPLWPFVARRPTGIHGEGKAKDGGHPQRHREAAVVGAACERGKAEGCTTEPAASFRLLWFPPINGWQAFRFPFFLHQ
jgi:hypothetical protein